jgi:hypothetical protein
MVAFENNTSATIQNKGILRGLVGLGHDVDIMTLQPNQNSISYDNSMNDIENLVKHSYYIQIDCKYALFMAKKNNAKEVKLNNNQGSSIKNFIIKRSRLFIKKIYDGTSIFDAQKVNVKGVSDLNVDYSRYDIIISASDPKSSHLIVERILKENKGCSAKWIQYWGDPMLIDITRKKDWRDRLVKYHENRLISKADKVVYASPLTLNEQREVYPHLAFKMDYASQVYASIDNSTINTSKTRQEENLTIIGYFGAYRSSVRNIIPLYNAIKESNYKMNICGPSDVILENTNVVSIYGNVPYYKALEMEAQSDILVCICNIKGTQIPGKIYYCTSYKKPIIVVLDGEHKSELKSYFDKFDRFILCDNDEASIRLAIEKAKIELTTSEYKIPKELTPEYMAGEILNRLI